MVFYHIIILHGVWGKRHYYPFGYDMNSWLDSLVFEAILFQAITHQRPTTRLSSFVSYYVCVSCSTLCCCFSTIQTLWRLLVELLKSNNFILEWI